MAGIEPTTHQNIIIKYQILTVKPLTTLKWLPSTSLGSYTCTSDLAHLSPQGLDLFANMAEEHIYQAVCEMVV